MCCRLVSRLRSRQARLAVLSRAARELALRAKPRLSKRCEPLRDKRIGMVGLLPLGKVGQETLARSCQILGIAQAFAVSPQLGHVSEGRRSDCPARCIAALLRTAYAPSG